VDTPAAGRAGPLPRTPPRVALSLATIALLLLTAQAVGLVLRFWTEHDYALGLIPLFDLNRERNAPALFSTGLFVFNATLFARVAAGPGTESRGAWRFLAGLFLFLAADEWLALHERLVGPVRSALAVGGIFYYAWVIPYGLAVILLTVVLLPAVWRIGHPVRSWLLASAAIYLAGAIGFEMLGARRAEALGGQPDLAYNLLCTAEESLEIGGLILLTYALLSALRDRAGRGEGRCVRGY
jgi:hypothetical protein